MYYAYIIENFLLSFYYNLIEHLFDRKEEIMTLRELGEEYMICADELKKSAAAISERLKYLDGIKLYEASRDLKILRDMERDSRSTGTHLIHYYDNKTDRRVYHSGR